MNRTLTHKRRASNDLVDASPQKKSLNDSDKENSQESDKTWGGDTDLPEFDNDFENVFNERRNVKISNKEIREGRPGAILSVTLINFMCHSNFHLDLSPRINFIVGKNGSGKSAILNGIVLGFGGRATVTSRGKSINTFIKTGQTQARIVIELLNNNGTEQTGYRVNEFGDKIIIERTLYSNGTSSYKIKSANNKLISDKREILDEIVRHFHIQIENPICVLNQEISRNFLNSNKPADKYKFFMKATLLETQKNEYAQADEAKAMTEKLLGTKKRSLPELEKQWKKVQKKVDLFSTMEGSRIKLKDLNNELIWAQIYEEKDQNKEWIDKIKAIDETINKLDLKFKKLNDDLEREKNKKQEITTELENLSENYRSSLDSLQKAKEQREGLHAEKIKYNQLIHNLKSDMEGYKKDENNLIRKIDEFKKNNLEDDRMQRLSEMEKLKAAIDEMKEKLQELSEKVNSVKKEEGQTAEKVQEFNQQIRGICYEIDTKNRDIKRLMQSKENRLHKYGENMPELLKEIEKCFKNGQFKVKPLGPFGEYIELMDSSADVAVEACLKSMMYSFCCDNFQDANALRRIMNRIYKRERPPRIVTMERSNRANDVSQSKVRSNKYKSVYDLIKINDPWIENIMLDTEKIESYLFIPNYDEAMDLLIDASKVPINCNKAYTSDGSIMIPQKPNQGFRTYASNNKSARILVTNTDSQLNTLKGELKTFQENKVDIENQLKNYRQLQREKQNESKDLDSQMRSLKTQLYSKSSAYSRLENEAEPQPIEIETLEKELQNCRDKKKDVNDKIESSNEKLQGIKASYERAEKEYDQLKTLFNEMRSKRDPLNRDLDDTNHLIDVLENTIKKCTNVKNQQINDKKKLEGELKEKQQQLNEKKERALLETTDEVKTKRNTKAVSKDIKELENFIREEENKIGDKEKLIEECQVKRKQFERARNDVNILEIYLEQLRLSLEKRKIGYMQYRDFCTYTTKQYFSLILQKKGFTGDMEIYHTATTLPNGQVKKGKTLEVKVNPKADLAQVISGYGDTRSLSGGERSYSTVSFILALWKSAECPFKILDEVDVFMDTITRKISLSAMVEFASSESSKQYIFLSPLGHMDIPKPKIVKIFQMPDPKRILSSN